MTETVKRIIELMQQKGDNAHSLEINAKLPNSSISAWKNDKFKPSTESIKNLAKYFNVSADYLLCLTDERTPLYKSELTEYPTFSLSTEFAELSQDKRFVGTAKIYKELPDEYRERAFGLVMGIAAGLGLNVEKIIGV